MFSQAISQFSIDQFPLYLIDEPNIFSESFVPIFIPPDSIKILEEKIKYPVSIATYGDVRIVGSRIIRHQDVSSREVNRILKAASLTIHNDAILTIPDSFPTCDEVQHIWFDEVDASSGLAIAVLQDKIRKLTGHVRSLRSIGARGCECISIICESVDRTDLLRSAAFCGQVLELPACKSISDFISACPSLTNLVLDFPSDYSSAYETIDFLMTSIRAQVNTFGHLKRLRLNLPKYLENFVNEFSSTGEFTNIEVFEVNIKGDGSSFVERLNLPKLKSLTITSDNLNWMSLVDLISRHKLLEKVHIKSDIHGDIVTKDDFVSTLKYVFIEPRKSNLELTSLTQFLNSNTLGKIELFKTVGLPGNPDEPAINLNSKIFERNLVGLSMDQLNVAFPRRIKRHPEFLSLCGSNIATINGLEKPAPKYLWRRFSDSSLGLKNDPLDYRRLKGLDVANSDCSKLNLSKANLSVLLTQSIKLVDTLTNNPVIVSENNDVKTFCQANELPFMFEPDIDQMPSFPPFDFLEI